MTRIILSKKKATVLSKKDAGRVKHFKAPSNKSGIKTCAKCGGKYGSLTHHLSSLSDAQFRKHGGTFNNGKRNKP